jgi:peptidoglycan/LPS O-acetylase OafA/YrhL
MPAEGAIRHAAEGRHYGLTRLRLLFIGWVVAYHLDLLLHLSRDLPWLGPLVETGYLGVDGFFLLSGFVLWLGYGQRPPVGLPGIGRFWLRRFARTWPLHAAALLGLAGLVGLVLATGGTIHDPGRFALRDFLLQAALLNGWETTSRHAWNSPSWALSVEWAGYLAFPLLVQAWRRAPSPALPAMAALCLGGLWTMAEAVPGGGLNHSLHLGLLRFFLEFGLGLSLGRLATEGRLPPMPALVAGTAIPLGLLLRLDALTVAGLALLVAAVWQRGAARPRAGRPDLALRLGEASFGIYLCWVFVEAGMVGLLRLAQPGLAGRGLLFLAGLALTFVIGWLAWRLIEEPARRWILERGGRAGQAGPSPAATLARGGTPQRG